MTADALREVLVALCVRAEARDGRVPASAIRHALADLEDT